MERDLVVMDLAGVSAALDTSVVASIAEVPRLAAIPGQSGIVVGIISLRGEPVTVVDLSRALTGEATTRENARVVVAGSRDAALGLNIGRTKPRFLWKEDLAEAVAREQPGRYATGRVETPEGGIILLNWMELFEEATRILSGTSE